jgi:hypothetical protein
LKKTPSKRSTQNKKNPKQATHQTYDCHEEPSVNEEIVAADLYDIQKQRQNRYHEHDRHQELLHGVFEKEADRLLVEAVLLLDHKRAVQWPGHVDDQWEDHCIHNEDYRCRYL